MDGAGLGSAVFGAGAMAQAALVFVYALVRFGFFFWGAPSVYWPVWVSGAWDVAAVPAAFALQAWWQSDPIGLPMWLFVLSVGPSMWLNIEGAINAPWGSNAAFSGTPNWMGFYNLTLTGGATPAFAQASLEAAMLIVLTAIQGLLVVFWLFWACVDNGFEYFSNNLPDYPGRTVSFFGYFPTLIEDDFTRFGCMPTCALGNKPRTNERTDAYWVSPLLLFLPCFGSVNRQRAVQYYATPPVNNNPRNLPIATAPGDSVALDMALKAGYRSRPQALVSTIGFMAIIFWVTLYIEYGVAEGNGLQPAPGMDSTAALLVMGLILSIFPIRRVNMLDNAESVRLCGNAPQINFLYFFTMSCLFWGALMGCFAINEQISVAGGSYWASAPGPSNVTTHGYRVVIGGTGGYALLGSFRAVVQVATFFLTVLAIASFLAHLAYAAFTTGIVYKIRTRGITPSARKAPDVDSGAPESASLMSESARWSSGSNQSFYGGNAVDDANRALYQRTVNDPTYRGGRF